MQETQIEKEPLKACAEQRISCRGCGTEPGARDLLKWYQRGLWWKRSVREQLLCDACFGSIDEAEQREWIAIADLVVD